MENAIQTCGSKVHFQSQCSCDKILPESEDARNILAASEGGEAECSRNTNIDTFLCYAIAVIVMQMRLLQVVAHAALIAQVTKQRAMA